MTAHASDITMLTVEPTGVTPALRALLSTTDGQCRRCFAVLDGAGHRGRIFTDDPTQPTWGAVWEACDGVLFLAGALDRTVVAALFARLRQEGEVLLLLADGDPRLDLLPPDPYYDGWVLEFYDRPVGQGLEGYVRQLPPDCSLRRLDHASILRTPWGPDEVEFAGGITAWEQSHIGYALMRGNTVLCAATAGPSAIGLREPGVITVEEARNRGFATMTAARLIQEIEAAGERTYWNCALQNVASAAVARKLGYRTERRFRCLAWHQFDCMCTRQRGSHDEYDRVPSLPPNPPGLPHQ